MPQLETETRQNNPREFHSKPQNHDPNRNNFGGTGQNRSYLNRVSSQEGSSNSSFYSSYDSGNYRSKARRQYPNTRH